MSQLRIDANTYCLDVEIFISEIKNYPVIWDLKCQDNRYKTKKQAAWDEIVRKFIPDFDDLPPIEKLDVYRRLHNKWRNIRDSYVRHIKKRDSKRGYMYARHLAFLNNLYNHAGYSTDDEDQEDVSEEEVKRKRLEPNNDSNPWPSDSEDMAVDLKRHGVKREIEVPTSPFVPTSSFPIEDADRSFFESLLPAVRGFDLDQKLEFRCEVLRLVKKIRRNILLSGQIKTEVDDGFD